MSNPTEIQGESYTYTEATPRHTDAYLMPALLSELQKISWKGNDKRIFEIGCGNGATANTLTQAGYTVTGIDPSTEGIAIANRAYRHIKLEQGSAYDDLRQRYGQFQVVISLEVVEHVYYPRSFAKTVNDLLLPGGIAIISTPYHSYWKNLALAISGKMDSHFTALWDHGHIKFWSRQTMRTLLDEAGLDVLRFHRVGRIPLLAKSFITVARKR